MICYSFEFAETHVVWHLCWGRDKLWTEDDIEDMDFYQLLGLGHLAMRADADLIKRACESVTHSHPTIISLSN